MTDLESVYHILQILNFYDHHTSDYGPAQHMWLCRPLFVTHLQHIYQAWGSWVLFALTDPAHKVCFALSHPQRTDHASEESLDNLGRGPEMRNMHQLEECRTKYIVISTCRFSACLGCCLNMKNGLLSTFTKLIYCPFSFRWVLTQSVNTLILHGVDT